MRAGAASRAPPCVAHAVEAVAGDGGLITDPFLRSVSDSSIFAVGDCAAFDGKSLPRIGVYAVRQAPVLLRNIVATLRGQHLLPFKPQRDYLSIVGLGRSTALMVRGNWWFKGPPALWLKRWIDQRFVHGLEHNSNDVAITQAIIALSHSLGLRVIAEGVETRSQFAFLKNHGCEAAQGFLIGRPLEEKDFLAWWKAQESATRSVQMQPDMWQPEGSD